MTGPSRSSLDRALAAAFPLLLGGLLVRLVVTGRYRDYVKASMWPWLTLAGLGLLAGAVWELAARRALAQEHRPAIAWLLLVPVVVILGAAPGALGSAALERSTHARPARVTADGHWAPLDAAQAPIEMTIGEFVERTYAGPSTTGVPVTLVGFVAADDEDGTAAFRVVRFRISCCAADAAPVAVRVMHDGADTATGASATPAVDAWVRITGTLEPDTPAVLQPRFHATALDVIPAPSSPYESLVVP